MKPEFPIVGISIAEHAAVQASVRSSTVNIVLFLISYSFLSLTYSQTVTGRIQNSGSAVWQNPLKQKGDPERIYKPGQAGTFQKNGTSFSAIPRSSRLMVSFWFSERFFPFCSSRQMSRNPCAIALTALPNR